MSATQQSVKATFTQEQVAGAVATTTVAVQKDRGMTKVSTGNKEFDKAIVSLGKELVAGKVRIEGVVNKNIAVVQAALVSMCNEFQLTSDMLKSNMPARVLLEYSIRSVAEKQHVVLADKTVVNYLSAIRGWLESDRVQQLDLYGNAKRLEAKKQQTASKQVHHADGKDSSEGTGQAATSGAKQGKAVASEQVQKLAGILPLQTFLVAWLKENQEVADRHAGMKQFHAMAQDLSNACAKELPQNTPKYVPETKKEAAKK